MEDFAVGGDVSVVAVGLAGAAERQVGGYFGQVLADNVVQRNDHSER